MSSQPKNLFACVLLVPIFILACDGKSKKDETRIEPQIHPKTITLPSGETFHVPGEKSSQQGMVSQANDSAERCVKSICNVPETFLHVVGESSFELDSEEQRDLPAYEKIFDAEIWPQMQVAIEASRNSLISVAAESLEISEKIPDSMVFRDEPIALGFLKYAAAFKNIKKYNFETDFDNEYFSKNRKFKLSDAVLAKLSEDEKQTTENTLVVFNNFYEEYLAGNSLSVLETLGLRTFLLHRYYSGNFEKSKEAFLKSLNEISLRLKTDFPTIGNILTKSISFQKVLRGEELTRVEEVDLKEILSGLYIVTDILDNKFPFLNEVPLSEEDYPTRNKMITSFGGALQKLKDPVRHKASLEKTYKHCKKIISAHLSSRPTESQLLAFNALVSKIKSAVPSAVKKTLDKVDESESQKLSKLLSEVRFSVPTSKSVAASVILGDTKQYADLALEDANSNIKDFPLDEQIRQATVYYALGKFSEDDKDEVGDMYSDFSDFCERYLPESLSDAAVTIENRILTSPKTIKAGINGTGVVAHEIGHRVWYDMGPIDESLRACLKNRHFGLVPDDGVNYRSQYLSEDFADRFATVVQKELGLTKPQHNMACQFYTSMNGVESGTRYPLFSEDMVHPFISVDNEHSAKTFRLIVMANELGHTTEACRSYGQSQSGITFVDSKGEKHILSVLLQCPAKQ